MNHILPNEILEMILLNPILWKQTHSLKRVCHQWNFILNQFWDRQYESFKKNSKPILFHWFTKWILSMNRYYESIYNKFTWSIGIQNISSFVLDTIIYQKRKIREYKIKTRHFCNFHQHEYINKEYNSIREGFPKSQQWLTYSQFIMDYKSHLQKLIQSFFKNSSFNWYWIATTCEDEKLHPSFSFTELFWWNNTNNNYKNKNNILSEKEKKMNFIHYFEEKYSIRFFNPFTIKHKYIFQEMKSFFENKRNFLLLKQYCGW